MDYEKILEEQMNNVIDPDQAADITNKASEITGGLSVIYAQDMKQVLACALVSK